MHPRSPAPQHPAFSRRTMLQAGAVGLLGLGGNHLAGLRALAAQGMKAEDIKRMDFDRLRAGQRDGALREVKASLILEQIADEQKIEVSDEELDQELAALATQAKQPVEQIRARLTQDGGLDRIRHRIRDEKTLNHLYRRSA